MASRFDIVSIRGLVVHSVVDDWNDPESIAHSISHGTTLVKKAASLLEERLRIKLFSLRVTLPPTPLGGEHTAKVLSEAIRKAEIDNNVYYGLLHIDASMVSPESIIKVLKLGPNVFGSASTPVTTENVVNILYEVAKLGPEMATWNHLISPQVQAFPQLLALVHRFSILGF